MLLWNEGEGAADELPFVRGAEGRGELEQAWSYDVRVVNDDLERACSELQEVIETYENNGGHTEDVCDQARD